MSLARMFPSLSLTLIRKLGDAGGPRADQVSSELDSLIAWAKQSPRVIKVDTSTVNSSGGGPDTLHTFSLPAGSLATNGDFVEVEYGFVFTGNDNDKAVRATFGGTEYMNRGVGKTDLDGTPGGTIRATIVRLSSTSVHVSATVICNFMFADSLNAFTGTSSNGGFAAGANTVITGLSDLAANATTMAGQSLGVGAADVSQRLSVIKLYQQ